MSLPGSLRNNPRLADWVQINEHDVIVRTGKVELGQGISTAIAMIAAEELDLSLAQIRVETGNTVSGPNEFITAGSMSVETSGSAMRQACAEVRSYLLELAAERLATHVDDLTTDQGLVRRKSGNESVSYWELLGGRPLPGEASGNAVTRPVNEYKVIGQHATRVDLRAKIDGSAAFLQDLRTPGQLFARIVRPRGLSYRLDSVDTVQAEAVSGVIKIVIDGEFIGVIADDDYLASRVRAQLLTSARWHAQAPMGISRTPTDTYPDNAAASLWVRHGTPVTEPIPERINGDLAATYSKPFHLHGSMGPSAAWAHFRDGKLDVISHSQGPSILRAALAAALRLPIDDISVSHMENAGCYGHNGADDAAMDACVLAMAVPDRPVLLKWERQDEHQWEPFSPAMVMKMEASMSNNTVTCWNADIYSTTHSGRPGPDPVHSNLIAAWQRTNPMPRPEPSPGMGNHSGIHRNAEPYYDFANTRIVKHLVKDPSIRTSSTRGLGAFGNVFAIESFMDELALSVDQDPVAFRLQHLSDPRAQDLVSRCQALAADYRPQLSAPWISGKGFAFARYKNRQTYVAMTVFLAVNENTLETRLEHAVIVADAGLIIDRDGLANQLEGGFIQSASWALKEAVRLDEFGSVSTDWDSYPILSFTEIPTVEIDLMSRSDQDSLGAGEATQGPTPAAIANAIYNAVHLRIRDIPFTPDRLRSIAMEN
jgi:CO/xanthine dehydrogenase Mo-binding subunit